MFTWLLTVIKGYAQKTDSLRFPIEDRRGDPFTYQPKNHFDIADTAYLKRTVEYDPVTHRYYIVEKIGNSYYRKPTYLTYEEFWKLQNAKAEKDYFMVRAHTLDDLNKKVKRPKMQLYHKLFDRMFGLDSNNMKVDIRPQGTVDLALGYMGQRIDNPSLSEAARKTGGFDFDMNANLSMIANIGNKLKLPINYNTLANFDFENQLKLDYKGMDDEIIRSIEAGNISFQTRSSLVSGVQSLFGVKTQLQFGRLGITAAIANQRSEKKSATLAGGGATTTLSKKLDDYDENRNFLLAQYFRNNFNKAMGSLPVVNSQIKITRMEVWVTNRTGSTTNARYVAGLADLGEPEPANSANTSLSTSALPQNGANDLYAYATSNETYRNSNYITSFLKARGLTQVNDFEKIYARKLTSTEYSYNAKVGFLCLNGQLQSSDALAVAFQYTYNGKVYQVGEFSEDVTVDSTSGIQKVLFLKLLKGTSQRVALPMWHLMMKNVYSVGVTGIDSADFTFNVLYREASGGDKIYLPESATAVEGKSLLSILKLDRLNSTQNSIPDGMFDYVNGYTILPAQGKIIFPVLEPFGKDLDTLAFAGMPASVKAKYVYYALYDSIKAVAQTYANLNRFVASGSVKGTSSSSLSLGAFNIPSGSVTVRAGANTLKENVDYTVDYSLGTVTIINQALLASGTTVTVDYESSSYAMQQRNFMGVRLDYKASDKLALGATFEHLGTTPFYSKVNVGDDPISNSIYGVDFTYASQSPGITRALNKLLPFYHSTTNSAINASGEFAYLKPGHASQIGSGTSGAVYIDDFESASSSIDIRYPATNWALASTPSGNSLFPEAELSDSIDYNRNRAKLAWYTIESVLQNTSYSTNPLRKNLAVLSDPRMRAVYTSELYPDRTTTVTDVQLATLDLAYYPEEKGPYNFEARTSELTAEGRFRNPKSKWGGIMRSIDQSDFETANIAYVEFWMQDPFIKKPASTGGKLHINLGSVSEDILKDGKHFYENGLSTPTQNTTVDSSGTWGKVPVNPVQQTQAFSNETSDRAYQDVGYDGLNNEEERRKRGNYLGNLLRNFQSTSTIYQRAYNDPSDDDYVWYRDDRFTENSDILVRYKNYNNPQGNSPVANSSSTSTTTAATTYPDNEDLNRDNVMNETEAYYEYAIDLTPGSLVVGSNYITDKRTVTPTLVNGSSSTENWYLFRIPIEGYTSAVGGISDFKSIQFSRMYLSGFEDSVVLRFGALNLVRSSWRSFTYNLDTTGSYTQLSTTSTLDITSVGLEDNSARTPIPYKLPPDIARVQTLSSTNTTVLEDERSMSMKISGLTDGEARAVFKTMSLDVRKYGKLSMYVHAEGVSGQTAIANKDLNLVVRIGQDFLSNYYEIKIPLTMTSLTSNATAETIWPTANNLDFSLQQLVSLKVERNDNGVNTGVIYRKEIDGKTYSVMGNPNLGDIGGVLIAVENPKGGNTAALSTEVWVDELRLSEIDEHGAWAAIGRVDMQLADLGTFSLAGSTYSQGWGTVEQSLSQRSINSTRQVDAALQIDAGKLLPSQAGITMPMYAGYSKTVATPEYDPYNLDIKLSSQLKKTSKSKRDSILNNARDISTMQTLTFTNVRFGKVPAKPKLWSLSNFDFTFAYTRTSATSSVISLNDMRKYRGGFGYTFNGTAKYIQPFKGMKWKTGWLQLIRDFNINLNPSLISFRTDVNRQMGMYTPRIVNTSTNTITRVDTTYNKKFTFDRYYNLRWDLSRSLNIDFSATNRAIIDEPEGKLDTKQKRDSVWKTFWKGGRPLSYQQKLSASYTLPLAKFPLTNWITTRYTYGASYAYTSASLSAKYLGNTLQNSLDHNVTAELDFARLYSKWKWLARVSQGSTPVKQNKPVKTTATIPAKAIKPVALPPLPERDEVIKDLHGKAKRKALRQWRHAKRERRRQEREKAAATAQPAEITKAVTSLVTMVKRASISYTTNVNSYVPGYMDSSQFLGQNWKSMQPGLDYIFGKQPNAQWMEQKARLGLLSADSTFNDYFQQGFSQQFNMAATLQPLKDFTIEVTVQKTFSKTYSELFKDTTGSGLHFSHLSGTANGGFSVSFISFQTLFRKSSPSQVSETFKTFQNNRLIVSSRMARLNAYQDGTKTVDGYYTGYGRYSQNVLIPAFVAAYTNKDAHKIALLNESNTGITSNPFSGIKPLPNWNATYSGLTRIPALSSLFSSIVFTHAYSGTLSMNSYSSDLTFNDPLHLGTPGFIDSTSGNFVPYYIVPNITIQEQFSPLIGIDVTTLKQLNVHLKYNRSRQLSLSLSDYQLSEVQSSGWDFGLSWRTHGLDLPFTLPFMKAGQKRLQNDLGITVDFSYRRDAQSTSVLDENVTYVTGGQRVIKLSPSIDYTLNKRINISFYFDRQKSIPYVSTSSPITVTKGGVKVRIALTK
ncbi:T9SS outer membrane translocon Sov/SprA [Filimonas lacunae]|uniref:T9SS outer membrane translocon Sov/SprA n=1 Tax=Filimonas lacunae TaxID=477680 RepID=UPI0013567271|nr:cell surface protein SprA [Filimonas lacunae]